MFNKKRRKKVLFRAVDDTRVPVYDFRLRTTIMGVEDCRAVAYQIYPKLREEEMLPLLEKHLQQLFAGEVDSANANLLDALIFSAAREAIPVLQVQRNAHVDTLHRIIARRKADYADIARLKAAREREYDELQADYENVCAMMEKIGEVHE